jgi:anaerobic magnesium-protoporphyrin IX monomethyl ester cyclase
MMPYPPLGTLYAASHLRNLGYAVAIHDVMFAEHEGELDNALDVSGAKILVIYDDGFNYLTKMCLGRMRAAAIEMIRLAKEHCCTVILCSSDSTDHSAFYLEHGADYIVLGEGEITLGELVDHLCNKSATTTCDIPGLVYLTNGRVEHTSRRHVVSNLDSLAFPAWDLLDLKRYRAAWSRRHGFFSLNLVTTRGCPFHCNWCAKPIYGQVYNSRTPANVVQEMKFLLQIAHLDHLWFADDIFGLKPGWIQEFASELEREHLLIPFKCLSRVDLLLKDGTIRQLKRAGCETVWVGAESGSQKVLDAMEKGTTVEQIYESSRLLKQEGIKVGFFLQYGYPSEDEHDIADTLKMLRECQPDEIGISVSYPLPGTKFYEKVKQDLKEKQNWIDSADLAMMFRGTFHPDFYRVLHKVTHKTFRISQGRQVLKSLFERRTSLSSQSLRQLTAMLYHKLTLGPLTRRMNILTHGVDDAPSSLAEVAPLSGSRS